MDHPHSLFLSSPKPNTVATTYTENFANRLLLASNAIDSGIFYNSVVYVCEHNEQGAMGVIINYQTNFTFDDILQRLQTTVTPSALEEAETKLESPLTQAIYIGGPVQTNHGFVLHTSTPDTQWKSSLTLEHDLALTTSLDIIEAIAQGKGPQHSLIALGHALWDEGQLEDEIIDNYWLCCPVDTDILFNVPSPQRWQQAANVLGVDINMISPQLGHG